MFYHKLLETHLQYCMLKKQLYLVLRTSSTTVSVVCFVGPQLTLSVSLLNSALQSVLLCAGCGQNIQEPVDGSAGGIVNIGMVILQINPITRQEHWNWTILQNRF